MLRANVGNLGILIGIEHGGFIYFIPHQAGTFSPSSPFRIKFRIPTILINHFDDFFVITKLERMKIWYYITLVSKSFRSTIILFIIKRGYDTIIIIIVEVVS